MSVHKRKGKWQVKWQEPGGRQRSRTFDRKGDADRFDAEVKRRKQLGPHLVAELGRSALTRDQFVREGFRTHAATLAPATRDKYAWAGGYLRELHGTPLVAIDVPMLAAHQRLLLERGATPTTVREVLARLSGILQIAVEHGHLPANPARGLRKVPLEVPAVTARELKSWRLESGGRDGDPIVGEMSRNAMRLWARRTLPEGVTLYRLRHTHASALHYCGFTLPAAARRMGHGPQLHLKTYAHVIDALGATRYEDLDALIAEARASLAFPGASPAAHESS